MRILPVASGKGGVGKTTFALNFALTLAKKHKTVLIDLDTGTSSLRNILQVNVGKDLFHYIKKDCPLDECRQALPTAMDPDRAFADFSFIASPRSFIQDIVNLRPEIKAKLILGINSLRADFVVIDLKAGLDYNVLDFLPLSNSGIILFTPRVRAATLTAAEITKAILFRMLGIMLNSRLVRDTYWSVAGSPFTWFLQNLQNFLENGHELKNLDDFISEAARQFPQDNFLKVLRFYIENYKVYYVLNQFNSVAESMENAIKPFVENIFRTVSSKVSFHNLGWVVNDEEIRKSTETGIPYMVFRHYEKKRLQIKSGDFDSSLREMFGLEKKKPLAEKQKDLAGEINRQIDLLRKIYICNAGKDPETNLDFIVARVKEISDNSVHQFGMKKIYSVDEFLERFQAKL